jgi:glycerophosphoryl diester phosphodiesterase
MRTGDVAMQTVRLAFPIGILALYASCASAPPPPDPGQAEAIAKRFSIDVEGHRGARAVRPENTLPAFRYALEVGVDTLEMDLHATKDGVLVVSHDPLISRELCLDERGKPVERDIPIRSLKLMELKAFDCGSLPNRRFPDQVLQPKSTIPTFEEVLRTVQVSTTPAARKVRFNVEMKSDPAHPDWVPPPKKFAEMVIKAVKKRGFLFRTTLQSFDYRTLEAARELEPGVSLSVLVEDRPKELLSEIADRYKAKTVSPNHEWLTKDDVEDAHNFGLRVIPWTANSQADWDKLIEFGVDGIITDDPKALLDYRSAKGGRPPTFR